MHLQLQLYAGYAFANLLRLSKEAADFYLFLRAFRVQDFCPTTDTRLRKLILNKVTLKLLVSSQSPIWFGSINGQCISALSRPYKV